MRREDVERVAHKRPFQTFEVRLVDGELWMFSSTESFYLTKGAIRAQDREGRTVYLDMGMISAITILEARG